jgi:hypothetical protein
LALSDLASLDQALADLHEHTRLCTACGGTDHDSHECVAWLRERWASVSELVGSLRIETASLARGETLTVDEGALS